MDMMDGTYFTRKGCLLFFVLLVAGVLYVLNGLYTPFVRPPEIGRDLPRSWRAAKIEFRTRVEQTFTVGMSAKDLVDELERQGFKFSTYVENYGLGVFADGTTVQRAHFNKFVLPCGSDWFVDWQEKNAIVTKIKGAFSLGCL